MNTDTFVIMKQKNSKQFFQVMTSQDGDQADVYLYGYIGQESWWDEEKEKDLTDLAVALAIAELDKQVSRINIRINSYGGSVIHGDGIISAMRRAKAEVHTYNDGMAASMAFGIWAAGQRRHAATGAKFMVHAISGGAWGNAKAMLDACNMLKKMDESSAATLAEAMGKDEEEIHEMFFADYEDHWLSRKDVEALGLITEDEKYPSQSMPANAEQMSYAELAAFFQQQGRGEEAEEGFLHRIKKLMPQWLQELGAGGQLILSPSQITVPMNKQELETSLGKDITPEEVAEVLRQQGYQVAAPAAEPPAEETNLQQMIADALQAAVKPLNDTITSLQEQVTALGGKPGANPAMPQASGDPADDTLTDEEKQKRKRIQEINQKLLAGFREGKSIRLS
jgi:ATP-dependent protease ClpP protease subunit